MTVENKVIFRNDRDHKTQNTKAFRKIHKRYYYYLLPAAGTTSQYGTGYAG